MNIILDTNVFISALLKDSGTRKIILNYDGFFLCPSYIFIEIEAHKPELLKKSGLRPDEFEALFHLLQKKVLIVPGAVLLPHKAEAVAIVRDIDIDDAVFIACALAYKDSILWSQDKRLKKQHHISVLDTEEIIKKLK